MKRSAYSTDLTDAQWAQLEPHIPPAQPGGRPRSQNVRELLNALFYRERTGCQWRLLPHDFPKWPTVYAYFRRWQADGTFAHLNALLQALLRLAAGREV